MRPDTRPHPIARLGEHNYPTWRIQMKALLVSRDLWEYVGGPSPKAQVDQHAYKKKLDIAYSALILALEPDQIRHAHFETAKEIWENLERVHQFKAFSSRLSLLRRFQLMRPTNGQSIKSWVAEVQGLVEQIKDAGVNLPDEMVMVALTQGLPHEYNALITDIVNAPNGVLTLEQVVSRMLYREAKLQADTCNIKSSPSVLPTPKPPKCRSRPTVICYACQEKGHYAADCPQTRAKAKSEKGMREFKRTGKKAPATHPVGAGRRNSEFDDSGEDRVVYPSRNKNITA